MEVNLEGTFPNTRHLRHTIRIKWSMNNIPMKVIMKIQNIMKNGTDTEKVFGPNFFDLRDLRQSQVHLC